MDWDILIPILMFAFPVVLALLDKRFRQKRTAAPPSRPAAVRRGPGNTATLGTLRGGTASEAQRWGPTKEDVSGPSSDSSTNQNEEGLRAIHRKEEEETKVETQPADKLKIDKKKLIIYSEILKPKFDA